MVLWEITLGTAYFLGLKRTYKLALRIQRKLISPKHPKIRQFLQRRTRYVFDMALRVHLKVQERDIEVGRNLGNWILRWLDKMKPEAQIRSHTPGSKSITSNPTKQLNNPTNQGGGLPKYSSRNGDRESDRHLFSAARNIWPKTLPTIAMMKPTRPVGSIVQHRRYSTGGAGLFNVDNGFVVRNDIMQWIARQ